MRNVPALEKIDFFGRSIVRASLSQLAASAAAEG